MDTLFLRMRRLSLTLLIALLALPAAAIASRADKGDGVFELKAANGTFDLTGRGVVIGQMDKGSLRVQSLTGNSTQQIAVSSTHQHPTDDPNTTVYTGTNIHIRVSGGKYHIHFKGSGVDLTAVGVGVADVAANPFAFDFGSFAVDGGKWVTVPLADKFVNYGAQPAGPVPGP